MTANCKVKMEGGILLFQPTINIFSAKKEKKRKNIQNNG